MSIPKLCLCAALSLLLVPPSTALGQGAPSVPVTAGSEVNVTASPGAETGSATSGSSTVAPAQVAVSLAADEFYDWAKPRVLTVLQSRRPSLAAPVAPADQGEHPQALALLGVESPAVPTR